MLKNKYSLKFMIPPESDDVYMDDWLVRYCRVGGLMRA